MDPKVIAAGAAAFLLAAAVFGPLDTSEPEIHAARMDSTPLATSPELEQQIAEAKRRAEEDAYRRQAEHERRLKEIADDHAIRQANLKRRFKEIDNDYQRSISKIESDARVRAERQRQADQDYRDARISNDNAYLASQRASAQQANDRHYREQERIRTGRRD